MPKKTRYPLVTIMANNYNTKIFLPKFMKSVIKTTYPNYEVVIIDDHSTDGGYEWLMKYYGKNKKVRIIRNERNMRLGYSRTKGIEEAKGKYTTFMDVDTRVDKNWISESVRVLENDKSITAVQSVVRDLLEPKIVACAGLKIIPPIGWVINIDYGKKEITNRNTLYEVFPGITGIVYRKNVFKKIGYFDRKIAFNIDDVDFGLRLSLAGYKVVLNPKAITYHLTSKPTKVREKAIKRIEWDFHFMKMPRVFIKNYEWDHIFFYMPVLLGVYFLRVGSRILRGDFRPFIALMWSLWWNIKMLPDSLRERKKIQALRKVSDNEMFKSIADQRSIGEIFNLWRQQIILSLAWAKRVKTLPAAKFLLK